LDSFEVEQLVRSGNREQVRQAVQPLRQSGSPVNQAPDPQTKMEIQILQVLLQAPGSFTSSQVRRMLAAGLSNPQAQRILEAANSIASDLADPNFATLLSSRVDQVDSDFIRSLVMAELPVQNQAGLERYAKGVVSTAMLNTLGREKQDLMAALRRIDAAASPDQVAQVQRELVALESERRELMK
jgi:DNA primase